MPDGNSHIECVNEWMKHASRVAPDELAALFEKAMDVLWRRTYSALGDITVAAIVDRVLHNATEKYAALGSVKLEPGGLNFAEFRQHAGSISDRELKEAVQFVLVELLTVIGNLTAEILTPTLHSELASVTPKDLRGNQRGEKKL